MVYIDACMHTDIQTNRHTDVQTYRRTNIQTDIQTDIHAYTHTCIHTLHYLTWRYPIFVTIHIDSQLFIWMRLHHLVILRKLAPFFANPVPSAGMLESSRRVSFGDLCWKGKTDASCSRDTAETPRLLWSFLNNSWKGCGKDGCFQRGRTSWKKVKHHHGISRFQTVLSCPLIFYDVQKGLRLNSWVSDQRIQTMFWRTQTTLAYSP